jgi:CrcB protein
MMTILLVALGAFFGAPLRYLADRAVQARHDSLFPWGTFTVNVTGSLILGVLAGDAQALAVPASMMALLGTGLCGTLTTYSTFCYETIRLAEGKARFYALINTVATLIAGLGAVFVGFAVAQAVWQ